MSELDKQGRNLLALLVSILPHTAPRNPATFITYKEVHVRLGLLQRGETYGRSLKLQGLVSLADWTATERKPAITGLIVTESTRVPGEGYFGLFGKSEFDFDWWADQIQQSKEFDWSPYLPDTELPKPPLAGDLNKPPERQKTVVYRILRDTFMAMRVKLLHRFECQICGVTIELPNGGRYAEAHHIKPLGAPHHGPDAPGNILCLCPNHHAELDYGVRPLILDELRRISGHTVDEVCVNYHNDSIHLAADPTQLQHQ